MAGESNDDESDDESVENSEDEELEEMAKNAKRKASAGGSGATQQDLDDDISQQSWEEYCYVCQDGGNVMCCEGCPQVAHYKCVGFKFSPKGEWWCKDCTAKKAAAQKKQTSSRIQSNHNHLANNGKISSGRGISSARQATLASIMPTRSSRRSAK